MRPGDHEHPFPHVFRWLADDNSEVLATKIPFSYGIWKPEQLEGRIQEVCTAAVNGCAAMYYGCGNHGGGPTIRLLDAMHEYKGEHELIYATPRTFADAVKDTPDLPVIKGDLQHHASGCYSTMSELKKLNRLAEARLCAAERWDTIASDLFGVAPATEKLAEAWKTLIFNQFHDVMGGCSIREALDDTRNALGGVLHTADVIRNAALQRISWAIDTDRGIHVPVTKEFDTRIWETDRGGAPHVLFNPHPFPIVAPMQILNRLSRVEDENGNPLPIQSVRASRNLGGEADDTLLNVELAPLSYRTVFAFKAKESPVWDNPFTFTENSISNGFVTLTVDPETGCPASLISGGKERLGGKSSARVIDSGESDTWAHAIFEFNQVEGRFFCEKTEIVERGPVRATIRTTSRYRSSTLVQEFSLTPTDKAVTLRVSLNWQEENRILKLCYPISGENVRMACEQPFGHIVRDHDSHEEPGQSWADAFGTEGGLLLANDAKYSYALTPVDGIHELRLNAVRSAVYADHITGNDRERGLGLGGTGLPCMDIGRQEFTVFLMGHDGEPDYAENTRRGRLVCLPPEIVPETYHKGTLPLHNSYLSCDCDNVLVEVLKTGADGGIVIRAFESAGAECDCTIELPSFEKQLRVHFSPYQVKTLRLDGENVTEVGFFEQAL